MRAHRMTTSHLVNAMAHIIEHDRAGRPFFIQAGAQQATSILDYDYYPQRANAWTLFYFMVTIEHRDDMHRNRSLLPRYSFMVNTLFHNNGHFLLTALPPYINMTRPPEARHVEQNSFNTTVPPQDSANYQLSYQILDEVPQAREYRPGEPPDHVNCRTAQVAIPPPRMFRFEAYEGQTQFVMMEPATIESVSINGVLLGRDEWVYQPGSVVVLREPRHHGDFVTCVEEGGSQYGRSPIEALYDAHRLAHEMTTEEIMRFAGIDRALSASNVDDPSDAWLMDALGRGPKRDKKKNRQSDSKKTIEDLTAFGRRKIQFDKGDE